MRSSKINYFLVGLFVCAMISALVVSIAMVTGRTGATEGYYTVYDNVTGVKYGTQVIYEGYPIGQVEKVTPQPQQGRMEFRVDFSVTEGWKIPEDSQIEIAAPSLLSAVALQIQAGLSRDSLVAGDRVNSRAAKDVMGSVSSLAEQVTVTIESDVKPLIQELTSTVKEVKRFVADDTGALMGDATVVMTDVRSLVSDIAVRVPGIADNLESFSDNMDQASAELRRTMSPSNREALERVLAEMHSATADVRDVLGTMDKVLGDVDRLVMDPKADLETVIGESRYIVESVSRHIDSINQNLESASRNMNEFSRQIRANPGLLLGGTPQADPQ